MNQMLKWVKYLKSLWGTLSATAILFPGAATLLKMPIAVENSLIKALYPTISSIFASFALLLLFSFKDSLNKLQTARKVAVFSMIIAFISVFGFIFIKTYYLDVMIVKEYSEGDHLIKEAKKKGIIMFSTRALFADPVSHSPDSWDQEKADPLDMVALILFTLSITSLTLAFGSLGIYSYYQKT